MNSYDLVVIGGGPGGYTAAFRAAQMGASVALVEKGALGGTCLNRGCIPTKALLSVAARVQALKDSSVYGLDVQGVSLNYRQAAARKDAVVDQLAKGLQHLAAKYKVDRIQGKARFFAPLVLGVELAGGRRQELTARNIVIATGAEPAVIGLLGYDGATVVTSNEVLNWVDLPDSILIIGGGVIGCELATLFNYLGSKVTVIEAAPLILPMLDKEIAKRQQAFLQKQGITIKTNALVTAVTKKAHGAEVVINTGEVTAAKKVLVSVGRTANTAGLGLEAAGIQTGDRGQIVVDEFCRTTAPGVYAVGDVTGKSQLAHMAGYQGMVAANHIAGRGGRPNYYVVPSCVYTHPEIAAVGLTSEEAEQSGRAVKTGRAMFAANGKALCIGDAQGFVKLIADAETGRILGTHIIGPHATDLISEAALAVRYGLTAGQLADTIHPHPTLSEVIYEAAASLNHT